MNTLNYYNQLTMKITFTSKLPFAKINPGFHTSNFVLGLSMVCCFLFSMTSGTITAQANASVAPVPQISTEDYPGPKWKSSVDYSAVLTTEQSNTVLKLADPNLLPHDIGLYTGYNRMLTYMQEELTNQLAVEEIALKSFNRVFAETPGDAILKNMHAKDFETIYASLLPKLTR